MTTPTSISAPDGASSPAPTIAALTIDVVSDVMCPWCYIGKRRLENALDEVASEMKVDVRWRPYQLDPTLPKEGISRKQYLEGKFGDAEGVEKVHATIRTLGAEENIAFAFEKIPLSPNTLDAHRLIRWAVAKGLDSQDKMVDILFRAFFEEGKNIGDHTVLMDAAAQAGLDPEIVAKLLASDADVQEVSAEIDHARQMGVTGVPCFIIDMKYAIVGAQPTQALTEAMRRIVAEKAREAAGESGQTV